MLGCRLKEQFSQPSISMSFVNKVILVTGASSGIGAATAIKFANKGAKVALVGRNETKLKSVAEKCDQNENKSLVIIADVTKDEDAERLVSTTIKHFGQLDILVNNAGAISGPASIASDQAMEIYDKMMSTNLRSVVKITNLAVPYLLETKGNIINISSVAALFVLPRSFAYCTSKAALDHFTRCIALELAPKGVRVNAINPGPVKTDIVVNANPAVADQLDELFESYKKVTALNRMSDADEIADLILYVASDKARSITGSVYLIDNGVLIKGAQDVSVL